MKVANYHYSKYLLSVRFERGFCPDTVEGQIEQCQNFLEDLGNLAREHGRRLFATYSVCSGFSGVHAHFCVSWLPLLRHVFKSTQGENGGVSRNSVVDLFAANYFYVDNPKEAIKEITGRKRYVTEYVIHQPKDGQSTIVTDFYTHPDFVPVYSEIKIHSYCLKAEFALIKNAPLKSTARRVSLIVVISVAWYIVISVSLLSMFTNFPN